MSHPSPGTAALVPGDEVLARRERVQLHGGRAPGSPTVVLGVLENLAPQAVALKPLVDGKHRQTSVPVAALNNFGRGYQVAANCGHKNDAVGPRDCSRDLLGLDAKAIAQFHVGGPPFPVVRCAERSLDQLLHL